MITKIIIWFFLTITFTARYSIELHKAPNITWTNRYTPSPIIQLYLKTELKLTHKLDHFWLKWVIPYDLNIFNARYKLLNNCCDLNDIETNPIPEIIQKENGYTTVYTKISEQFTENKLIYIVINSDVYSNREGLGDYIHVAIVSSPEVGYITYAENKALFKLYVHRQPNTNIILQDATLEDASRANTKIRSVLQLYNSNFNSKRIIIQIIGEYSFTPDDNAQCSLEANSQHVDYECSFWEDLGDDFKRQFLVFRAIKGYFPPDLLYLSYNLNTPKLKGKHNLNVYLMAENAPIIYEFKQYINIFQVTNYHWANNFPKLYFAGNYDANDTTLPNAIGLYSMSTSYNQVFNNLLFILKADYLPLESDEELSFTLTLDLGSDDAVLPLGYVYTNVKTAINKKLKYTYKNGRLSIHNVDIKINEEINIGIKVGYPQATPLRSDSSKGFGVLKLLYNDVVVISGRAHMRNNFNVVRDNKNGLPMENYEINDALNRRHRGYSIFRSESPGVINSVNDYFINSGRNGLRLGTNQNLWFISSIGPNNIYTEERFSTNPDSNQVIIDIYLHNSIKSTVESYSDSNNLDHCAFYSTKYSKWNNEVDKDDAEASMGGIVIQVEPSDYNFVGGCNVKTIDTGKSIYTRLRMRFTDKYFKDTNGIGRYIKGIKFPLVEQSDLLTGVAEQGNMFAWKNIDITKNNSFFYKDVDSVITDAFVFVYFTADTTETEGEITVSPSIVFMDNLYILSNTSAVASPSNVSMVVKNNWTEDSSTVANKYKLETNDASLWPDILYISGNFYNLPNIVRHIIITFDFILPLTHDNENTKVDCSVFGSLNIEGCYMGEGLVNLQETPYISLDNKPAYLFRKNGRLQNYIRLDLKDVPDNTDFSLVFPTKLIFDTSVDNIAELYLGRIKASPAFMFLNSNHEIIQWIDFGTSSVEYNLNVFDDALSITDVALLEINPGLVSKLDDEIVDDNPSNAVWVEKDTKEWILGETSDILIKSNCDTDCSSIDIEPLNFGAATICLDYDFTSPSIGMSNASTDVKSLCHKISYINSNYIKLTCVFCPNVTTVTNPQNDSSALVFTVTNFQLPRDIGIKWNSNTVSVLSNSRAVSYAKLSSLNTIFKLKLIDINQDDIILFSNIDSQILLIDITLPSLIPVDGVLFMSITSGCEQMLTIKASSNAPCLIYIIINDEETQEIFYSECSYILYSGGIEIKTFKNIEEGSRIIVKLYGLSVLQPNLQNYCEYRLRTYINNSRNNLMILADTFPNYLKILYKAVTEEQSISIESFTSDTNIINHISATEILIQLNNRLLIKTDSISINMGSFHNQNTNSYIECQIFHDGYIDQRFKVCNTTNLKNIKIKTNELDVDVTNIQIKFYNVKLPVIINDKPYARYLTNDRYISFSSNFIDSIEYALGRQFHTTPEIIISNNADNLSSDLSIKVILDIDLSVDKIMVLEFESIFNPSLTQKKLFSYLEYNGIFLSLTNWLPQSSKLCLTGWPNMIQKGTSITIHLYHLSIPFLKRQLFVYFSIVPENNLGDIIVWDELPLPSVKLTDLTFIYLSSIHFDNTYIKDMTSIKIDFSLTDSVGFGVWVHVYLNYIVEEFFKELEPICYVTETISNTIIGSNCEIKGMRLQFKTNKAFIASYSYILNIKNIPNPDILFEAVKLPDIFIFSSDAKFLIGHSLNYVTDIDKIVFHRKDDIYSLEYDSINEDGYITLMKGFYSFIDISAINSQGNNRFFDDLLEFTVNMKDSLTLVSEIVPYYRIDNFTSSLGAYTVKIVVGASYNAVSSDYLVQVARTQTLTNKYSELPFLRVRVIESKQKLRHQNNVNVYKGYGSLPVYIKSDLLPTENVMFDIFYQNGATRDINTRDEEQQFMISVQMPVKFLLFSADIDTIHTEKIVEFKPANEIYLYDNSHLKLNIIQKNFNTSPQVNFKIINSIGLNEVTFQISANEVMFLYYYLNPLWDNTNYTQEETESKILKGSRFSGSKIFGFAVLEETDQTITYLQEELLSSTVYELTGFYRTPDPQIKGSFSLYFQTIGRADNHMYADLYLASMPSFKNKQAALCVFVNNFYYHNDNIWTDEGINCISDKMHPDVYEHVKNKSETKQEELSESGLYRFRIIIQRDKRKNFGDYEIEHFIKNTSSNGRTFLNKHLSEYIRVHEFNSTKTLMQNDFYVQNVRHFYDSLNKINKIIVDINPTENTVHAYIFIFKQPIDIDIYKVSTAEYLKKTINPDIFSFNIVRGLGSIELDIGEYNTEGTHSFVLITTVDSRAYTSAVRTKIGDLVMTFADIFIFKICIMIILIFLN